MTPPASIAHYRITAKLGEGGMGAVYRATDTRLNREVAIKVVPPAFAEDAARMQRFEREAQVLASLNHPNIATIYGVEQGAIVMELVEGDDLKGPMPPEKAADCIRQIAAGLDAAHEKGIVHRDLKPANIRITREGVVKVLDFGLAKAGEPSAASAGAATQSPTISIGMTQAGVILGTAAYMAPEQAAGKPVDRRADIWAFGVVVYELLTGARLFEGETTAHTIAEVLRKDIDLTAVPARFQRLVRACLERDPRLRLQSIGDARLLLEEGEESGRPKKGRPWLAWIAAAVSLAAGVGTAALWLRPHPPELLMARFPLPMPEGSADASAPAAPQAVPSDDGRYVAFIATSETRTSVWVRPLNSPVAHRLEKTEGANLPFWSPDGQSIAFFVEDKLKRIPAAGGTPQTICTVPPTSGAGADGGTWNADGVIVFAPPRAPLMRVPAGGGPPTPITKLDTSAGEIRHSWPRFLPDGRHFLYFVGNSDPDKSGIYVQELGSPQRTLVMHNHLPAAWAPPGYLLYAREGTLFARSMDLKTFRLTGEPSVIADEVTSNEINGRAAFAVSRNGVLVYRGGNSGRSAQLAWYNRDGKRTGAVGPAGNYYSVRLSPDEQTAALVTGPGALNIWVMNLATGALARLTKFEKSGSTWIGPWSTDSKHLAVNMAASVAIQVLDVASGKTREVGDGIYAEDWLQNGALVGRDYLGGQVVLIAPDSGEVRTINSTPFARRGFHVTADGKHVAYVSNESGSNQVFVAAFPSFEEKRQISVSGGVSPDWSRDGRELFFLAGDGTLMSASISPGAKIEAGKPRALFRIPPSNAPVVIYAPSADGRRFLVIENDPNDTPQRMVVVNWTAALKK